MDTFSAHQALTVFSWFLLAVLLVLLLLIARLYQKISGKRTFFWAFAAPIMLFGVASARYAFADRVGGDPVGDVLWAVSGLLLIGLCGYLYYAMTARS